MGLPEAASIGRAYALAGRREQEERIAAIQPRQIEQATIFVALGDKNRAFEALDHAIPFGAVRLGQRPAEGRLARMISSRFGIADWLPLIVA
jgi:hypothetical protein